VFGTLIGTPPRDLLHNPPALANFGTPAGHSFIYAIGLLG
jgi:hypothetical protein